MNKCNLTGRVTKDIDCRYTQSGSAYTMFTIAVNRMQKDANGQTQADFISCTAFGQSAEYMGKYIKKGYLIGISGRIQTRNYQGQDGQNHYVTEVVAEQVENLTPRELPATSPQPSATPQPRQNPQYGNQPPVSNNVPEVSDDLPF